MQPGTKGGAFSLTAQTVGKLKPLSPIVLVTPPAHFHVL